MARQTTTSADRATSPTTNTSPTRVTHTSLESAGISSPTPISTSGSGSSGSGSASKAVARQRIAFQKATGLRDIGQALQEAKDVFARGVRDNRLGIASGTARHEDVLRQIEDQRIAARTNLEQGLRDLQLQRETAADDRSAGLTNILDFEEDQTERVVDASQARGLSRSGIQAADEQEVADDATEDRFDLNTSIDNLLEGITNDEGNLEENVKNILATLEKDESAANEQFKFMLTSFSNLLDDLGSQKAIGIREAGEAKEDLLREVELALKALNAQSSGGGGGGPSGLDILMEFLNRMFGPVEEHGVPDQEQHTEGGVPVSKLQENV